MTSLRLLMAVLMLGGSLSLGACSYYQDDDGAAENTGEAIDDGVNEAGEAVEDTFD